MSKKICRALMIATAGLIVMGNVMVPPIAQAADVSQDMGRQPVRVGFFAFEGYHMEHNGERSGYGYEVLQLLLRYANWKYQYIGYDNSWKDMQQMLAYGDIDILTSAQKTPDREAEFDFSDLPIGYSAAIFTVRAGDERLEPGDYRTYDGVRVGMLEGNSRNEDFQNFAAEKGFSYVPVYFSTTQELTKALQEGNGIDAIVTSNLRSLKNEWILDQFSVEPFYIVVRKGNKKLLSELNYSLGQLDIYYPEWRALLFAKYYSPESGTTISFSAEERAYIRYLKEQGIVFKVALNPDNAPYSYFNKQGKASGILVDIFTEVAARAGIQYEFVPVTTQAEYAQLLKQDAVDIDLSADFNYSEAEQSGFELTSPYLNAFISQVARKDFYGDVHTVAIPEGMHLHFMEDDNLSAGKEIRRFPTTEACVEAVLDGSCDAAYLLNYTVQQYIRDDPKGRLRFLSLPKATISQSIGVSLHTDYRLLSILNKSVDSVRGNMLPEQVILKYAVSMGQARFSLERYFYDNPYLFSVMAVLVALLVAGTLLARQRAQAARKDHERRMELERFLGYVCRMNDLVLEVDIDRQDCLRYRMKHSRIQKEHVPYRFDMYIDNIHPDERTDIVQQFSGDALQTLIREEQERYFECRIVQTDGSYRWYAHAIRGIPQSGLHPNSFILFRRDIDEAKQAEELKRQALQEAFETARRASSAKGAFLSSMSHEIRTPLNAIIGYLTLAQLDSADSAKIKHCLESSEIASRHLLHIINDVLDISAIESGHFKIAREPFNLRQQITPVVALFYAQARDKGLEFSTKIQQLDVEWVIGDQLRVSQILMNLLSNAIKFTPSGGSVTLDIQQNRLSENRILTRFDVGDTGIGMSPEYLQRIFMPFEQESPKTVQQFGGTGLGLSITHNLISLMQGSIEVNSEQGKGSVFTVTLPFVVDLERANQHWTKEPRQYSHLKVLVVDDTESECEYVLTLLKRCGIPADFVLSGREALAAVSEQRQKGKPYDLCIIDWKMAGMDGIETANRIQQETDGEIPVVIVTAYDTNEIEEQARAAGVRRVIAKPLFPSTMFDLLVSYFGYKDPKKPALPDVAGEELAAIRILLVEDNAMNREIALSILCETGFSVDAAIDGKDAVDKFTKSAVGTYQCILMDIQMPVMNGYEATRAIRRSSHPEAAVVPIIAVTADVFPEDVSRAMACGMNDYISKPIDYHKLMEIVMRLTKRKAVQ